MKRAKKIIEVAGITTVFPANHRSRDIVSARLLARREGDLAVLFSGPAEDWRSLTDGTVCEVRQRYIL